MEQYGVEVSQYVKSFTTYRDLKRIPYYYASYPELEYSMSKVTFSLTFIGMYSLYSTPVLGANQPPCLWIQLPFIIVPVF
jgi:hypothetical protein